MRKPTQREREAEARGLMRAYKRLRRSYSFSAAGGYVPAVGWRSALWDAEEWCRREARKLRRGK